METVELVRSLTLENVLPSAIEYKKMIINLFFVLLLIRQSFEFYKSI